MNSGIAEILFALLITVVVVALLRKFNISTVLGYLVVGAIIGPQGFKVLEDVEATLHFAEFGVVVLLFVIGLELTFERLKEMRVHVFGFGSLQVLISGFLISFVTHLFTGDYRISFVIGFVFALSSTAVVMQVLEDRQEQNTQYGRLSLAALILQDLAFVPLLIMIPLLGQEGSSLAKALLLAIVQAVFMLAAIVVIGKKILAPALRAVAGLHSRELFIGATLTILLGCAWLTEMSGLSLALGAFVAGLLIAETEYRTQVETDIKPFKGLLMGFFFIAVGSGIDFNVLFAKVHTVIGLTAIVILIKVAVVIFLARVFKFSKTCSIMSGFVLAQSSEFGFVLFAIATKANIINEMMSQVMIASISFSMAITPLLAKIAADISKRINYKNPVHFNTSDIINEVSDLENHIIVVGFGNVGRTICELLIEKEIKFTAIDDDPRNVHQGRKAGFPIFFGKCNVVDNLENIGLDRARMTVVALHDANEATEISKKVKALYPEKPVVVLAKDTNHAAVLKSNGVNLSIVESLESSLAVGVKILTTLGLSDSESRQAVSHLRNTRFPENTPDINI